MKFDKTNHVILTACMSMQIFPGLLQALWGELVQPNIIFLQRKGVCGSDAVLHVVVHILLFEYIHLYYTCTNTWPVDKGVN